jgi:hypothetical protein
MEGTQSCRQAVCRHAGTQARRHIVFL